MSPFWRHCSTRQLLYVVFKRDSQTDTKTKLNQISQFGTSLSWWQEPEPLISTGAPRDVHASLSREPLDERMGVARGWKSGLGYLRGSDFSQLSLAFLAVLPVMIVWELAMRWLDWLRWKHLCFNTLLLSVFSRKNWGVLWTWTLILSYSMKASNCRRPSSGNSHVLVLRHVMSPKTRKTAGGSSFPSSEKMGHTQVRKHAWQLDPCEIPQTYTRLKYIEIVWNRYLLFI